jgi:ornithine cyclodeaminase/alanine dehydrogenase-like protein (mu-crystallin family)
MKLRILSESDCRAVLEMTAAIDIQAEAFALLAQGASVQGLRSFASSEQPPGVAIFNPCFLRGSKGYGVKIISDFYENEKKGLVRMSGVVALFSGDTGHPYALLEAGYLTDLRTGAGTGLAARHLARRDSRVVTIIGAGRVARNQLWALSKVVNIQTVYLATRTAERGRRFVERMRGLGESIPADIRLLESREEAVRRADIVIAATTSAEPVFSGEWLKPGTFVASVGAYEADMREVDSETIRRSSNLVIDSRTDCLDHAGDLVIPMREGLIRREQVAEIAELVSGQRAGRQNDQEITYYKSIGVPIQDLVTAQHIARDAEQRKIGLEVEIGGDSD